MRTNQRNAAAFGLLAVLTLALASEARADFVHIATRDNTQGNFTYVDNPFANGNPSYLFIVTPTWDPSLGAGIYNDHPIGVWYDGPRGRWAIFNQDLAAMPVGAAFFVNGGRPSENFVVLRCVAANIRSNSCYIDNPYANSDALVFATSNWNPGGSGGVYNNHRTGVWYDGSAGKWAVFNQDRIAMPPNAAFNVLIMRRGSSLFVHRASETNVAGNSTYLSALANRPPSEVGFFWVTPLYNPGSGDPYAYYANGVYYDHAFGVWYNAARGQWAIFNQDRQPMPAGVAFAVHMQPIPY